MSHTTISPVLHTIVTFTLQDSYSTAVTLSKDTTTITLISLDGDGGNETEDTVRDMWITEVDDASTPKTIKIKFPGAVSGYYIFKMETEDEGMWDYSNM